jgi:hypothetical protein
MKKIVFLSIVSIFFISSVKCQNLDGFTKHETLYSNGGYVSLYYKVTDYGIFFRVLNETNQTIHAKVYDVSSAWSDNRTRKKDVLITYANPSKTATGTYENNDNLSKRVGGWNFSRWSFSTNRNDLD